MRHITFGLARKQRLNYKLMSGEVIDNHLLDCRNEAKQAISQIHISGYESLQTLKPVPQCTHESVLFVVAAMGCD